MNGSEMLIVRPRASQGRPSIISRRDTYPTRSCQRKFAPYSDYFQKINGSLRRVGFAHLGLLQVRRGFRGFLKREVRRSIQMTAEGTDATGFAAPVVTTIPVRQKEPM